MIPYTSARFTRLAEEADALNVTAADYTVMVWGVAPTVSQVLSHFSSSSLFLLSIDLSDIKYTSLEYEPAYIITLRHAPR